jgi:hypothetical protein
MAKAAKPRATAKPSKKNQYERFLKTARILGIDNAEDEKTFEQSFRRIVPPRSRPTVKKDDS